MQSNSTNQHLSSYCSAKAKKSVDALHLMQLNLELIRAIHKANVYGEDGVVQLIAKGASIQALDANGDSPILIALSTKVASTIYFPLVKCLCENHANVSLGDIHGFTPFMTAVKSGDMRLVMLIYSYGNRNDLGTCNNIKESALHIACHIRSLEIVRFLVARMSEYGLQRQNINGLNAYHIAAQNGSTQILQVLQNKGSSSSSSNAIDQEQYKKTLQMKDNRGWDCLKWAIFAGHVDVLRQLFRWGIPELSEEETKRLERLGRERASSYVASGTIIMASEEDRSQVQIYLKKRKRMAERKFEMFGITPLDTVEQQESGGSDSDLKTQVDEPDKSGVAYQRSGRRK